MVKLSSRRAAIVLAGSVLAVAGGLVPAQAATTGWRIDTTAETARGDISLFTSVAASSRADAWATGPVSNAQGSSPQILIGHWTGKAWRTVFLPAKISKEWTRQGAIYTQVGAASARSVWIFGGFAGSYLRLNGGRWSIGRLPGASSASSNARLDVDAVKVFSSSNVWAFGVRESLSGSQEVSAPYAAHYNGHKWSRATVPGSGAIAAVGAASSSDMWAVEGTLNAFGDPVLSGPTPPVVLHWTASTGWQDVSQQPGVLKSDVLSSVAAEPNGDVWFGGSAKKAKGTTPLAIEWNGSGWSPRHLLVRATRADWRLGAMTPDGTGGIWALAQAYGGGIAQIWRLHRTTWSRVSPGFGKHEWTLASLVLVPGTHSVWAVGAVQGSSKSSQNALIAVDGPLPR